MSFDKLSHNGTINHGKKKAEEQFFGESASPLFTTNANEVDTSGFQTMRKNKKKTKKATSPEDEEDLQNEEIVEPVAPAKKFKTDKPKSEKPRSDKPKSDKPKSDKPKSDKPKSDKPKGEKKPRSDKPKGEKKPRKQVEGEETLESGEENAEKKIKREKKEKKESENELKVKAPLETGRAFVKAVPSGDTVVLQVLTTGAEKRPDITLSLSSLTAPRLGRYAPSQNPVKDQAFAWESRDFLRELVIGKVVSYVIENKNPKNNRDYGLIYLGEDNICKEIAANGWATVFKPTGREPQGDLLELINLSAEAEKLGLGIFQTDEEVRKASIRNFLNSYDIFAVYERFRLRQSKNGQVSPSKAFVEQVKTGSQVRLWFSEVLKGQSVYYNLLVRISGVECPAPAQKDKEEKNAPFFAEAKEFTEERILHRVVDVVFQGIDASKTIQVKIIYGDNVLSHDLVREGLAKVNEAHQTSDITILTQLENEAKNSHLRIWENYVAPAETREIVKSDKEFYGKVREIMSGTTIIVSDLSNSSIKKQINFSSLLPFKLDDPKDEALKEHIRKVGRETLRGLVGKKVRVVLDYTRQVQVGKDKIEERPFYSVYYDNVNVSKAIVEKGLAQVVKHRQNEKRSPIYDQLVIAEKNAEKRGEGRYAKNLSSFRANDLTPLPPTRTHKEQQDVLKKAKQYFTFLKTGDKIPCVIERVSSATKFKLYIPKETCYISFMLQGIKTPQIKNDKKSEPYAEEALEFARDKTLQRDGEVTIEDQDKFGNFSGTLFVNKQNFTTALLRSGYASLRPGANKLNYYSEYIQAEDTAKRANKKIWANWDEDEEEEKLRIQQEQENAHRASATHVKKRRAVNVIVSEITDASHFYVQFKDDLSKLEDLSKQIQEAEKNVASGWKPKTKDTILAKSQDGQWYRARIRETSKGDSENDWRFVVHHIDTGKNEQVKLADLAPIEQKFLTLVPQARESIMASISTPKITQDFGQEAVDFLSSLVKGKTLLAVIEDRDHDGKLYLTLGDTETNTHITAALLSNGYARINRRAIKSLPKTLAKLEEEEEKAKRDHLNLWQYGDISDDEDEDSNRKGGRRGKGRY